MASDSTKVEDYRLQAALVQHGQMVQSKKSLQTRIIELVVECAELPNQPNTQPGDASAKDVAKFKEALCLFQPSDLDDLVLERNIQDRCGYCLCPNPNRKAPHGGAHVWSNDVGFFVERAEYERWCSKNCKQRTVFVRAQLATEPAWLRDGKTTKVTLLDESGPGPDMLRAISDISVSGSGSKEADLVAKLKDLSLERGDGDSALPANISIIEREQPSNEVVGPPRPGPGPGHLVEGLPMPIQRKQTRSTAKSSSTSIHQK